MTFAMESMSKERCDVDPISSLLSAMQINGSFDRCLSDNALSLSRGCDQQTRQKSRSASQCVNQSRVDDEKRHFEVVRKESVEHGVLLCNLFQSQFGETELEVFSDPSDALDSPVVKDRHCTDVLFLILFVVYIIFLCDSCSALKVTLILTMQTCNFAGHLEVEQYDIPLLARSSAFSYPGMPRWEGIHYKTTILCFACSSRSNWWLLAWLQLKEIPGALCTVTTTTEIFVALKMYPSTEPTDLEQTTPERSTYASHFYCSITSSIFTVLENEPELHRGVLPNRIGVHDGMSPGIRKEHPASLSAKPGDANHLEDFAVDSSFLASKLTNEGIYVDPMGLGSGLRHQPLLARDINFVPNKYWSFFGAAAFISILCRHHHLGRAPHSHGGFHWRHHLFVVAALFKEAGKSISAMPLILLQPIEVQKLNVIHNVFSSSRCSSISSRCSNSSRSKLAVVLPFQTFLSLALVCFFLLMGFTCLQTSGKPLVDSQGRVTFPIETFSR
ncbi:choline transporter-like protein 1 [Caerostris extrusa]|uniref:Choline transporter-like protein 1 n=1 Tax=Caerostris extrusa TaxID=172846 RepID=A0AAV4UZ33_CAEEX|nr:choline transporter-like protein 1 [Caerostris extrusa]